jgi:undecaprenyl diphosphate synthase
MNTKRSEKSIHLGIIPDGSRRWAKTNGIENYDGKQSGETMEKIVRHVFENHSEISDLSIWALSTENLQRAEEDKKLVYWLLKNKMKDLLGDTMINEKGIRVNVIGSRWGELPTEIRELGETVVSETKGHKEGKTLNICIGYGGREEILSAVMATSIWLRKNPWIKRLHENVFERFLMIPKPLDIMIRTGGEKRLSGFMLYQIEYAELFFTDTLWPDFTTKELDNIMKEFSERNRRFGR